MFYRNKNVLVTGGAGLIGHELVTQLLERGAWVRATVYRERKLEVTHPRLEVVACDLLDQETCHRVTQEMNLVLHAAATIRGVKGQQAARDEIVMRNLALSVNMVEASVRAGVERFGWIGSSTIYPDEDHPFREEEGFLADPPDCYFGIAWVKRYGEKLCSYFHRSSKTRFAIARSGAIYGPHERFSLEDGHVLPALIVKAVSRLDPFPVWGDGSDERDFVYVSDFAEGFLLTVEKHAAADPINIATGRGTSIAQAVQILHEIEGYHPKVVYQTDQPSVSRRRLLDVRKAERLLGFQAGTSLSEGLRRTVAWYKATLDRAGHLLQACPPT